MKKILAVLLSVVLVLSMAACTAELTPAPEEVAETTTPYGSLDEINAIAGSKLIHPGVMGVTDEEFAVIDGYDNPVAEYRFSVNGTPYIFRCGAVGQKDISGRNAFPPEPEADVETVGDDTFTACRWYTLDGQYVLIREAAPTQEGFEAICDEMRALTSTVPSGEELAARYAELGGEYQDRVSQRAGMTVTAYEDGAGIAVSWANSAMETVKWNMTATLGEDGLLNYIDCVKSIVTTAEDGSTDVVVEYEGGEGFFAPGDDGTLAWTGAADEGCAECVFEKLPV